LHCEEHDDRRQDRQSDERQNEVPVRGIIALIDNYSEGPWIERISVQYDKREKVIIPTVDEDEDGYVAMIGRDNGRIKYQKNRK
jgi:hypothetical protein